MVRLMNSCDSGIPDQGTAVCKDKPPVKLEIVEDFTEEQHGPLNKRSRTSSSLDQKQCSRPAVKRAIMSFQNYKLEILGTGANAFTVPATQYNPLDEPSPLGLQLRKSPSLLDLIQMRLSQANSGSLNAIEAAQPENSGSGAKKSAASSSIADKMKASNFPASLLRIGQWEYKSRYEGDLVAKCYFAKHKLVWEVLEGGLKSKIEIQWSDIMALKANCPENGPSTLNVVLARQPLFFRETNPQPRKHTLWQATADFTDGQASLNRQHYLECPQGLLTKHFEKLIQCDMRLNFLSRQPDVVLDSPLFETRPGFNVSEESKSHSLDKKENDKASTSPSFFISPVAQSSSHKVEQQKALSSTSSESKAPEAPSPSSVMDSCVIEGNGSGQSAGLRRPPSWNQLKVPGLHPSMSMSDLVNHLGQCLNEQIASGNPSSGDASECQEILQDIAQYLFSDTQSAAASDERSLMARVNSLCCLLQKDPSIQDLSENNTESGINSKGISGAGVSEGDLGSGSGCSKPPMGMSRKDSLGDLLLHLPRIASLPKFLFDITEDDGENHPR